MRIPAVHGVGTGRKGLSLAAAVRCIAGVLAINDIRCDGQNRLGVDRIPVGRVFPQLAHKHRDNRGSEMIDAIVVVAELREVSLRDVIDNQALIVTNDLDARMTNGRQTICHDR